MRDAISKSFKLLILRALRRATEREIVCQRTALGAASIRLADARVALRQLHADIEALEQPASCAVTWVPDDVVYAVGPVLTPAAHRASVRWGPASRLDSDVH